MSGHDEHAAKNVDTEKNDGGGVQSAPVWLYAIVIGLFLLFWAFPKVKEVFKSSEEKTSSATPAAAPAVNQFDGRLPSTGTILMVDRPTPMADSINYQFEFDTQGDSVSVTYRKPSRDTTVKYFGKGKLSLGERSPGLVQVTSLTPGQEARVRLWRVVKVYLPQP